MLNMKGVFVPALLAITGLLGMPQANADEDKDYFTVHSLKGTYAIYATYQGEIAIALGVRQFDGEGNFTGTFILNEPVAGSTTGARAIVTGTQKGTYTINCNGSGVITRVLTASNGTTATQEDDFIVTGSAERGDHLLATALRDVQRTASLLVPGGLLVTRSYTRVSD